ncbi:MAG: PAS domain S-box protein [Candidatus Coatesbacteria bacterium]
MSVRAAISLQAVIDSLPFYVLLVDEDHRILLANRAVGSAVGMDPAALAGQYCPRAMHGLDAPFPGCPLEDAVREVGAVEKELYDERDGRWMRSCVYPVDLPHGEGKRVFFHTVHDITVEKHGQAEKERANQNQSMLNALLRISLEDTSLPEMLGKMLKTVLSVSWLNILPKGAIFLMEGSPERLVLMVQQGLSPFLQDSCRNVALGQCLCGRAALSRKTVFTDHLDASHEITYEGIQPHGHFCVPITSGQEVLGVLSVYISAGHSRDLREEEFLGAVASVIAGAIRHRRAEDARENATAALGSSEETLRTIFEDMRDGILAADVETRRFVTVNGAICRMLGYTREELMALGVLDIHPAEDIPRIGKVFGRMAMGEVLEPSTLRMKRKDGSVFFVDINGTAIVLKGRRCAVGVFRDITDRKVAEAERGKLEDQLRQAQKMEAIGRLAGGVAHDFNNALTVIMGFTDLLLMGTLEDGVTRQRMTAIRKSAEHAASLTRQLLAFSRRQVLQPHVLNLGDTVAGMEQMIRRLVGEDIEVRLTLDSAAGMVMADPGQIGQVLMNLAVNARDAMPGGGKLVIEVANADLSGSADAEGLLASSPHPCVMLAVRDTGMGMDAETKTRIFEPFFTTKAEGHGTGLGLSTVFGIVQQSGGTISVGSDPGHGTTFKVYLPRVDEVVATAAESAKHGPATTPGEVATVLVAEDEEGVRELVREVLESAGHRVLVAVSPEAALTVGLKMDGRLDLLLTDMIMPGMTGKDLAGRLQAKAPGLRVLFMSGYTAQVAGGQQLLAAGDAFIQKPFTPAALLERIREVLA